MNQLFQNEDLYQTILHNLLEGVYFINSKHTIRFWNRSAETITGFPATEMLGKECWDKALVHFDDQGVRLERTTRPIIQTLEDGKIRNAEIFFQHKFGHRIPLSLRTMPVKDHLNKIVGALEVFSDNSQELDEQRKYKELAKLAYLDQDFNIYNKNYLEQKIESLLGEAASMQTPFGAILIKLMNYDNIDEEFDSNSVEKYLSSVVNTLIKNSRPGYTLGRWDVDEFLIRAPNAWANELNFLTMRYSVLINSLGVMVNDHLLSSKIQIAKDNSHPKDSVDSLMARLEAQV